MPLQHLQLRRAELEHFVRELTQRREIWQPFVRHGADGRMYERVWEDEKVNAWLICWSVGQDTGWHDHDDAAAAISVIEGQLREERLRLAGPPAEMVLGQGTTTFVPANAIHRVTHAGTVAAVSIHAYSPPLRRTGAYTLSADGELQRDAQPSEQELKAEAALAL